MELINFPHIRNLFIHIIRSGLKVHALGVIVLFSTQARSQDQKVKDSIKVTTLNDIVLVASRIPEQWLKTGVQKAGRSYFSKNAAPSFFDALENLKGVQMITPSMGFRILNTRGFNNTTNVRFVQLVDGLDVQSPHIGSPIGNALGPGDLDIEQVEIVPGVAATLYGMNAINGLADFTTRNPFTNQGLSVQQKIAVAHLGENEVSPKMFSETSLRYARAINSKWAMKMNFTYVAGYDWVANDLTDLNPDANTSTGLTGADNPAKDPVNSYGNESSNRRTLNLAGKSYVVARTGYLEKEVTSYDLRNLKGDASVYYKPNANTQWVYTFRGALMDNVYQRANRFRLNDYFIQQHALQLRSKSVKVNVYFNGENTGSSYNLRSMAENIDRSYKSDASWYADYVTAYNNAIGTGATVVDAHRQARGIVDAGRFQPGTEGFHAELEKLQQINNWDSGAALRVKASFVQADMQWDPGGSLLSSVKEKTGIEMLWGIDYRTYIIHPDGNYFINPKASKENRNLLYSKGGTYLSLNRNVLNNKLRVGFAIRADKNDYFPVYWSPRFTAVYSPEAKHSIRSSWQLGYRFPIIFEAFSNVNSGGVKRVGGLPVMSDGIFENAWLQTSIASFQNAVIRDVNTGGLTQRDAIEKNKGMLKKNPYTYLSPEKVRSFEIGYRGMALKNRLVIDADIYFNNYSAFIAQVNMNLPASNHPDSIPYDLNNRNKQSPYRMWTNSTSSVYNYEYSLGLTYSQPGAFYVTSNVNYTKLTRRDNQDGLEDGFNTPEWMFNITLATNELFRQFETGVTWRWQDSFYWQSFLVSGNVDSYNTLDAFAGYRFVKKPFKFRVGATNLLNHYYNSFLGGPSIGGFYYCTMSFGIN